MLHDPDSFAAEPFRFLRASFEFSNQDVGAQVVMVTSSVPQEGKSFVISNLAVALARAGRRVALIDLNLRDPVIEKLFSLKKSKPGLSEMALDGFAIDDAVTPISLNARPKRRASKQNLGPNGTSASDAATSAVADFYSPTRVSVLDGTSAARGGFLEVLPAGRAASKIGESPSTRSLASILADVRERVDLVLIDAPHLLGVGDTIALTPHVDAYIVVARIDVVRRPMLSELKRVLDTTSAIGLGFVLVAPRSDAEARADGDSDRPRVQSRTSARGKAPALAETLRKRVWLGRKRIARALPQRRS
jgi:Mrp family chromosome partitioning ATPase